MSRRVGRVPAVTTPSLSEHLGISLRGEDEGEDEEEDEAARLISWLQQEELVSSPINMQLL